MRRITFRDQWALIFVTLIFAVLCPASTKAQQLSYNYSLVLPETTSTQQKQVVRDVASIGLSASSVFLHENKIHVGAFELAPEARILQGELQKLGYQEATVAFVQVSELPSTVRDSECFAKLCNEFHYGHFGALQEGNDTARQERIDLALEVIETNPLPVARSHVEGEIAKSGPGDPIAGQLSINAAALAYRAGDKANSAYHFEKIARGMVPSDRPTHALALMRLGYLYHSMGDRQLSFVAFREAERAAVGVDEEVRAKSAVNVCGLLMEYVKHHDLGTYAECRRYFNTTKGRLPIEASEEKATIELMYLETFYYGGDFEACIAESQEFLSTYEGYPVLQGTCLLFLGMSYFRVGQVETAIQTLESIHLLPLGATPHWKHIPDLRKRADELTLLINKESRIEESKQKVELQESGHGENK